MAPAPKPSTPKGGKKIAGLSQRNAIILFVVVAVGVFLYLRYRSSHQAAAQLSTASVPTTATNAQPSTAGDTTGGVPVAPDLSGLTDLLGSLQTQISGFPYAGPQAFGTTYSDVTGSFQPTPGATSSTVPSGTSGFATETFVPSSEPGMPNAPAYTTPVYSNAPASSLPGGQVSTGAAGAGYNVPSIGIVPNVGGSFSVNPVSVANPSYLPTSRILGKNVPLA